MDESLERMPPPEVEDLVYEHARVSGETFQLDGQTWAIHGFIAVDGDVIMAKFDSRDAAMAAIAHLWAAERGPMAVVPRHRM